MSKSQESILCGVVILIFIAGIQVEGKPIKDHSNNGVAFAFSGAGGRIAQHLALMEALVKGLHPSGTKIIPSYLSGPSSGAISSVALSAILESEMRHIKGGGFTWEDYKELIFNLTTSDVYDNSDWGYARIFTHNVFHGYILDNSPLEKYLLPWLDKMGYSKFGDLFLPTAISLVNQSSGMSFRMWSTDPVFADLDLIDVMMASASLPIAFPPRVIAALGDTVWIDGGTGIDTIPLFSLIQNPNVTQVYIICYGSALTSGGGNDLPSPLNDILLLKNAVATVEDMRVDLFNGAIEDAMNSRLVTYTYIPTLNQTFSALQFDAEKYEYELVADYTRDYDPQRIN